jgi:hypothetical protein
MVIDV